MQKRSFFTIKFTVKSFINSVFIGVGFCLLFPVMAVEQRVVASSAPVYLLAKPLLQDVEGVRLQLLHDRSPHISELKPSQVSRLRNADLLIYIAPQLETFWHQVQRMDNLAMPQVSLISPLAGKLRQISHAHDHDDHAALQQHTEHDSHGHSEGKHEHDKHQDRLSQHSDHHKEHDEHGHAHPGDEVKITGLTDLHVWLSPRLVADMTNYLVDEMTHELPLSKAALQQLRNNYATFNKQLFMQIELMNELVRRQPQAQYVTLHDAYGYFDDYFDIQANSFEMGRYGTIKPSKIRELNQYLLQNNIKCIWYDTTTLAPVKKQFEQVGLHTQFLFVDPAGIQIARADGDILQLYQSLIDAYRQCS